MKLTKLAILLAIMSILVLSGGCARQYRCQGNVEPNRRAEDVDRVKNDEERARMQRYVDDLQAAKTIVKSIIGPSGEIIDCVDIYGQPALKRQGMEDHKVQLAPSNRLPVLEADSLYTPENERMTRQLYGHVCETCPEGSVPMRRLTMETLKRFETLDDFFRKQSEGIRKPCFGGSGPTVHEYAHAARAVDNWGAESVINIWSPFVDETDEFSLSQIWVTRGSGSNLETVEAGWQKYYDLYGDWKSRLFIYFTPDNYGSGGGYNLSTGDFVQVSSSVYITGGFTNYSSAGGSQYVMTLLWYKDGTNGDWWLRYGNTWVGYYPRSLFDSNGLRNQGDYIDFGGEIVNTNSGGDHTSTDMGSGYWPYQGFGWAAYHRSVRYVDTSNFYRDATGLSVSATDNMCYDIDLNSSTGSWDIYFYYGGSGYNTYCK